MFSAAMDDAVEIQPFLSADTSYLLDAKTAHGLPSPFGSNYLAFGSNKAAAVVHVWFDVKVFYVRVSACLLDEAPDTLLIVYPKRDINTDLEINGGRISSSERVCFALRRDRVDADSAEAIYVNTNNLRTRGELAFEIYDKDELLAFGSILSHTNDRENCHGEDGHNSINASPGNIIGAGWKMECSCGITSSSCYFLKGRVDFSTVNPTMEVYVAGRSSSRPIVLTQTIQLAAKRKSLKCCNLDAIPEEEESSHSEAVCAQGDDDEPSTKASCESLVLGIPNSLYFSDMGAYGDGGDEGELSWFNAGVRVGVGLGLGMCLGVGIGVGLLMRTYQATAGSFRRRLF